MSSGPHRDRDDERSSVESSADQDAIGPNVSSPTAPNANDSGSRHPSTGHSSGTGSEADSATDSGPPRSDSSPPRSDSGQAITLRPWSSKSADSPEIEAPLRRPDREWSQDAPSWMISAIIHFCIVLFVTWASPPMVGRPGGLGGRQEIALTLGFVEATEAATTPIEVTPSEESAEDSEVETPEGAAQDELTQGSPAASNSQASESPSDASESATQAANSRTARPIVENGKLAPYAAILNSRRLFQTQQTASAVVAYVPNQIQPLTPVPQDPQQQRFDQIVDDFISYDIGQLRGAAGLKARRRFSQLSDNAIPALVRGLNKSASIHATCPVGVIASKLLLTLKRSNDPTLRQYAIDNIGRGVATDAPHYHRIMALRNRWLGKSQMPKSVETYVQRVESRAQGELMELMLALSKSTSDTVIASINSGDDFLAAAATLSVIQGRPDWNSGQRREVRTAVGRLAIVAQREELRELAREAKSSLRP